MRICAFLMMCAWALEWGVDSLYGLDGDLDNTHTQT